MRLLEYEAKILLSANGLLVPAGSMIYFNKKNRHAIPLPAVVKSQVPVGGRGKLGGVVIVETPEALKEAIATLFVLDIKGYKPRALLAESKLSIIREHYVSLLIDRDSKDVQLVAHKNGGVEVESNKANDFLNITIDGDSLEQCSHILAIYLEYDLTFIRPFLTRLYDTFTACDATLLEINPLIYTADGNLVCADCKMELDDAAAFRHPEWKFEDAPGDVNFVTLDQKGTVATIANGAGLAMATVDAVAACGMIPANFLDIGGGANTESVLRAFRRIMEFSHIEAIVINIFAGITRCDEVAKAIIAAKKQIEHLPPLFIRLAGTNFEEAVELLARENITTLATLDECLEAASEATHE